MNLGRKITGGRYKKLGKKKRHSAHSQRIVTKLGEEKKKNVRTRGGNQKTIQFFNNKINIVADKKIQKTKINNVIETPSNRFFARQNILTQGTIVKTDLGKAKITNRPSKEGMINGILLK